MRINFDRLKEIKTGVFNGLNIVLINLGNNLIKTIEEDAFDDMPYLYSVDLAGNRLTVVNANWFQNTPTLTMLLLSNNQIEVISSEDFKYMTQKRSVLNLNNNNIKEIDEKAFENFQVFSRIWLENNQIQTVPFTLLPNSNHTFELSLRGNSILCIADEILHNIAQSCSVLDFRQNPFSEECHDELQSYRLENKRKLKMFIDSKEELRQLFE